MLDSGTPDSSSHPRRGIGGFVGREAELKEIQACIAEVRQGQPWVTVIEGGAGIGKTALTTRVVAGLDGFTVLRAFCAREETDLNYGVIEQLQARVPGRGGHQPTVPALTAQAPTPVQVGTDLLTLLGELQSAGPVAMVIEDLQWADKASAQALGFVMRRLYADQVLTMLTARTEAAARLGTATTESLASAEASPGWSWLTARDLILRIRLPGLHTAEIRDLARLSGINLTEHDAERLGAHTQGNALYLATLLADADQDTFRAEGALPVPASLSAALSNQLAALPGVSRSLLGAVAVLDARAPLSTVADLADVPDPAMALDPLVAAGLVRWYPSDPIAPLEIPHPLQRDAVYAAIPPRRRRELHARAAGVVPEPASWAHRVAASDQADPALADELEAQAWQLIRRAQHDRAATFLLWAADMSFTREEVDRRLITAALTLWVNNSVFRFNAMRPQIEACSPSIGRDLVLGLFALNVGEFEAALKALYQTLGAAAQPDASADTKEVGAMAGHALSASFVWLGENLNQSVQLARQAVALGAADVQITIRAARTAPFAILLGQGPREALADMAANSGLPANPAATEAPDVHMLVLRGGCYAINGDLRAGRADLEQALRLASVSLIQLGALEAHFFLSYALFHQGEWPDAEVHADRASTIAVAEEIQWGWQQSHTMLALAAAGRGEWAIAQEAAAAARRWFEIIGPPQWIVFPSTAAAGIASAQAAYQEVIAALEPLPVQRDKAYSRTWSLLWAPQLVEAQIATGRPDDAAEFMGWISATWDHVGFLRPGLAWLAGALAEARGDAAAADRAYAAGLAIPPSPDDAPYYRARLEHAYARLLTTTGNPTTATQLLRSAHQRLSAMDARPYLERVNHDLADLHIPHAGSDSLAPLTDRERDVARLVADGLTNTETAARLYLSSKTIEYHLAHIYPKLGITSRRQLRDLMLGSH